MILVGLIDMVLGTWLLVMPDRFRRGWTNELGAVCIMFGLFLIVLSVLLPH